MILLFMNRSLQVLPQAAWFEFFFINNTRLDTVGLYQSTDRGLDEKNLDLDS